MILLLFSRRCIQLEWEETEKTSCGGSPLKKFCSRSSSSFAHWPVLEVAVSLGKVCGSLRPLQGRHFFFRGQRLFARFLPWIISGIGILS
jgi:hypothetical protein